MSGIASRSRRALLQAALGTCAAALAGCDRGPVRAATRRLYALAGPTMGGTFNVKIARDGAVSRAARAALEREVFAAVDAVDAAMSTYKPASELRLLNGAPGGQRLPVSRDLAAVLAQARAVSEASRGAFDPTVGPLVDAWGFGPVPGAGIPAAERVAAARARVDWRALELDAQAGTVTKARPEVALDLSGIAQGYGADRIAAALDAHGIGDYMIEVSGEVRVRGANAAGGRWRIGIEQPDAPTRRAHLVVPLGAGALATSGDYRNWFERDGVRYSHEIDPAAGVPVRHSLASVSVVHEDAARADAWATALFVLGPERGPALAVERGIAAYFLVREGTRLAAKATPGFAAVVDRAPEATSAPA